MAWAFAARVGIDGPTRRDDGLFEVWARNPYFWQSPSGTNIFCPLHASAPMMRAELQRIIDTMPLGSAWARETADRVGALLRETEG